MSWCFATVNGRFAEIFFDRKGKGRPILLGHCYVKESEYKTAREKLWIREDIKKNRFTYRNRKYLNQITLEPVASGTFLRR